MSRSSGLAHIVRQDDGTVAGVWGVYVLKSAFQPIFAFEGGKLNTAAFEGLIRPFREGEAIPPGQFFGSVPAVDRFHVETLTRTLHLLNAGRFLDQSASIFVNFDPSLFTDRTVVDVALREMRLVLHEAGLHPQRIVCEVTEQKSASAETLRAFVASLRASGFRIAVDDYGADESDISRIEELRPDIVKFDAHWVAHLMESGPGFALLQTMVEKFEGRGIVTIFEGIEEARQLELAEKSGASMVQGFILARPQLAPTDFSVFSRPAEAANSDEPQPVEARIETQPSAGQRQRGRTFGRRTFDR